MEDNARTPNIGELPTTKQLNRATLIAAAVAALVLTTAVLPAEYGIDPTGVGRVLGLTKMGEAKRQAVAAEPTAAATPADTGDILLDPEPTPSDATAGGSAGAQSGEVTLTLQPDEGSEVKATMKAGQEFTYEWSTGGPQIAFELHGEEIDADDGAFTSYEKGTSAGARGKFRAPFDGTHGWYWENRSAAPVTITVKANGTFEKFAPAG